MIELYELAFRGLVVPPVVALIWLIYKLEFADTGGGTDR